MVLTVFLSIRRLAATRINFTPRGLLVCSKAGEVLYSHLKRSRLANHSLLMISQEIVAMSGLTVHFSRASMVCDRSFQCNGTSPLRPSSFSPLAEWLIR